MYTEFFLYVYKEIRICEQHYRNTNEGVFMKFLGKFGHEALNTLEHSTDLAVNLLNTGSIFVFSGSVFISNIMGNA